ETDGYMQLPLMIWSKDAFQAHTSSATALVGSMIGIGIIVLLYYLSKFLRHRKKEYFYFLVFAVSISYGLMSNAGLTMLYVWPEYSWLNGKLVYASTILTSIFALLLTESFLDTRRHLPASRNIIKTIIWANSLLLFFFVIIDFTIINIF